MSSVIVFCAHSDDQILGVGGSLAQYANQGYDIHTVIFSFGELSHPWLKEKVAAEIRVRESEEADKMIGGKGVIFYGLAEGKFKQGIEERDIVGKVKKFIADRKPERIFTHAVDDPLPDHRDVYKTVVRAITEMNYEGNVFSFDIWNPINIRQRTNPQLYVDISDTYDTKMLALNKFKSQWVAIGILRWLTYFRDVFNGLSSGTRFAERFYRIK